jgi:uncharacterized protein
MNELPAIELLESTHEFPGPYTFKVIGWHHDAFAARVVAAIRDEMNKDVDPPFRLRHTSSGRHVAVTVEPWMSDAHQVLAVYRRLRATAGLIMLW